LKPVLLPFDRSHGIFRKTEKVNGEASEEVKRFSKAKHPIVDDTIKW
jgi:hypothetical protein